MFKVRSKTLIGAEPGKSQTVVMIERENPLKYLSWNLEGDWTARTDDDIIKEVLEQDYRLTYGNRAQEEERDRVNTLFARYEKQLETSDDLLKSVNGGVVELIKRMAEVKARVELAEYQLERFAEHSQFTLPEEVPDEEEDGEETEGKETNGKEKHEGGA